MAPEPQTQVSVLDCLPNEIVQHILDIAMIRDSPLYIDDPYNGKARQYTGRGNSRLAPLSSIVGQDPLFTQIDRVSGAPIHQHAPQSVHRTDWIAINSTNRRLRTLGKISFFRSKTIAMHVELPTRLLQGTFHRFSASDQVLALACINDIVIVDARERPPSAVIRLPKIVKMFPCLHRCTLVFGYSDIQGQEDHAEWITVAFALARSIPVEMQALMAAIGIPRYIRLRETVGPWQCWDYHQKTLANNVYPILEVKIDLLRAQRERESNKN